MIPYLSSFELEINLPDENEAAYTSKHHDKRTRNVILFVLEDKTESIFRLL